MRPSALCHAIPAVLVTLIAASTAHAAPGFAMRWDHCYADGGATNKNFACDTNTGSANLVVTFSPDSAFTDLVGVAIYLDIQSASSTVPPWWQMVNAGTCRKTAISANIQPNSLDTHCDDIYGVSSAGGLGSFQETLPGHIKVSMAFGMPLEEQATVLPGREYFAANLQINYSKSVGTGACAGCLTPMCLTVFHIQLEGLSRSEFLYGQEGSNSNTVGWQGGSPDIQFYKDLEFDHPWTTGWVNVSCGLPTPARNATWGAIKSLYR